jgi:hypothetical protein
MASWSWRDGSAVESIDCFPRGSGFKPQKPHSSSQRSATPVPGDLTLSYRHTLRQNTDAHEIKAFQKLWGIERLFGGGVGS